MSMISRSNSLRMIGAVLVAAAMWMMPIVVGAFSWQATQYSFYHDNPYSGTVSGGEMDGGIDYDSPGYRYTYAEGSYLSWTGSDIQSLTSDNYCYYNAFLCQQGGGVNYFQSAQTFHAFYKNSNTPGPLHGAGAWSNLPGMMVEYAGSNEIRMYIMDPASMSSSAQYYGQVAFIDTAFPGSKTNAEVDETMYRTRYINDVDTGETNKDNNAKLCVNDDVVVNTQPDGTCA